MGVQILVIDDEPDFCDNVADILGDLGYDVDVAYSGVGAIERVKQRPYDLFLIDYKLPCTNGAELYQRLKQIGASGPAMIVTSHPALEIAEEAATAGISAIIEKPVDVGRLLNAIEQQVSDAV